jgi:hypothetical protein
LTSFNAFRFGIQRIQPPQFLQYRPR